MNSHTVFYVNQRLICENLPTGRQVCENEFHVIRFEVPDKNLRMKLNCEKELLINPEGVRWLGKFFSSVYLHP